MYKLTFTSNGFGSKDEAKDNVKKKRAEWHCGERTKGDITNGILNGCIFSHAITDNGMQPSVEHSKGFQSIWLDIDDDGKSTIDEQIATLAIKPSIAYTTYSHRPEEGKYKYRMIYLIDEAIYCPYHRYTDIYVAFVKNVMQKPASVLQDWFNTGCKLSKDFKGFGVDMSLGKLAQFEFTTTPNAEIREYDTVLKKSDIESLTVGYIGEPAEAKSKNPKEYSEGTSFCTTFEGDRNWWDEEKERIYYRAYFSTDNLIHCDGYDVRGDGFDIMPERWHYTSIMLNGRKVWGLYIKKWVKGEQRKYIINRGAQVLFHNVPELADEYAFHFLIRWADNVMYRNSGGDYIKDSDLMDAIRYAHIHPWKKYEKNPCLYKKDENGKTVLDEKGNPVRLKSRSRRNAANSTIIDKTSPRWVGMSSRKVSGFIGSERRIQRAIDGICYGIENNLTLAEMVKWINGNKEENTTNKVYGVEFSEKSLIALVKKLYKKVLVDNEAYANKDNIIYSLSFDCFFNYSLEVSRLIEQNKKRRNNNWQKIMEMHQRGMSQSDIARTLGLSRQYVNHQILKGTPVNLTSRDTTTSNLPPYQEVVEGNILGLHNVPLKNTIIESLVKGITIKDIALNLGINEKTVKRYIKKAKDAGIIYNEGSKKFPKWVMCDKSMASGWNLTSKDTNINKEKQINKNTTIMNTSIIINENVPQGFGDNLPLDESAMSAYTGEYTDEDFINDTALELPYTCYKTGFTEIFKDEVTIPFKSAIAENFAGEHIIPYTQPTPMKMTKTDSFENVRNYDSSSSRTEYATEPFDNAFKAKAKCVLDDSLLQDLPSSSNTIEEDMPEDIYNGTVSDINTGMYRSERNDITMGLLPTPEKRTELKAKLASIISRYDNDVVGFVKSCNGFYMRFSQVASGELFYYNNTWRKNMEIEMKCTDLLIEELFRELGEEEVVAA